MAEPTTPTAPPEPSEPSAASVAPAESAADEPRSARRESTRQRILDAATVVFAEKGVIGATVEDICEQAGFTRGAVYSNFADKEDVLQAVVERQHEALLAHLEETFALVEPELAAAPDLESALGAVVDRILRSIPLDRQLSLVQAELEIHAIRRPELGRAFVAANSRFRARLADAIVDAMHRHGREPLAAPGDIVDTVIAIAERSARRASLETPGGDPDALSRAVLPLVLLGLSRPV